MKLLVTLALGTLFLTGSKSIAYDSLDSKIPNSGCYKHYTSGIPTYDYFLAYYKKIGHGMYIVKRSGSSGSCVDNRFDAGTVVEVRDLYILLVQSGAINP